MGERAFTTTPDTLSKSGFLTAMLSGSWEGDLLDNGSYFIDADPDIFEYVLRYLRHGLFPLFYDKSKGHDYHRYLAVLERKLIELCFTPAGGRPIVSIRRFQWSLTSLSLESRYLQINALERWIREKTYLKAVRTFHRASVMEDIENISRPHGVEVDVKYYPAWKEERVYICPRGISLHRGNPRACGRLCRNAQGDTEPEFVDESVLKVTVIEEETVFDATICMDDDR